MPKKLADWAPYYTWLARKGLVETDRSRPDEAGWGTIIEMVGRDFTVRFEDDYLGPIATIGSHAEGWYQIDHVVSFLAPKAFPGYPATFYPERKEQARQLKKNWRKVIRFFQSGDRAALAAHIARIRHEGQSYTDPTVTETLQLLRRQEAEGDPAYLAMSAAFAEALAKKP